MADYIDREEFKNEYRNGEVRSAIEVIDSMPSVDAVEVVRCKDCKYRRVSILEDICARYKNDISVWFVVKDDDYCKWGEKE